jgi:hypothetical protein
MSEENSFTVYIPPMTEETIAFQKASERCVEQFIPKRNQPESTIHVTDLVDDLYKFIEHTNMAVNSLRGKLNENGDFVVPENHYKVFIDIWREQCNYEISANLAYRVIAYNKTVKTKNEEQTK